MFQGVEPSSQHKARDAHGPNFDTGCGGKTFIKKVIKFCPELSFFKKDGVIGFDKIHLSADHKIMSDLGVTNLQKKHEQKKGNVESTHKTNIGSSTNLTMVNSDKIERILPLNKMECQSF